MPELNETEFISIVVVIPCFRVRDRILDVIRDIGKEISSIFVIDDANQSFNKSI